MAAPAAQTPRDELFVTGLPTDTTDELLTTIFSQYGAVKEVGLGLEYEILVRPLS